MPTLWALSALEMRCVAGREDLWNAVGLSGLPGPRYGGSPCSVGRTSPGEILSVGRLSGNSEVVKKRTSCCLEKQG